VCSEETVLPLRLQDQNLYFKALKIWNHTNCNNIGTIQDDGTTGQILGAGEMRILQLGPQRVAHCARVF